MESLREQAIFQSPLDLIVLFQICISWSAPHPAPRGRFGSVWFPPSLPRTLAPPPPALAEHGHRGYRAGTCFACCHLPKLAALSRVSVACAGLGHQQQLPLCPSRVPERSGCSVPSARAASDPAGHVQRALGGHRGELHMRH